MKFSVVMRSQVEERNMHINLSRDNNLQIQITLAFSAK